MDTYTFILYSDVYELGDESDIWDVDGEVFWTSQLSSQGCRSYYCLKLWCQCSDDISQKFPFKVLHLLHPSPPGRLTGFGKRDHWRRCCHHQESPQLAADEKGRGGDRGAVFKLSDHFFIITTNKVDSAATKELATEVEAVRNDNRVQKVFQQKEKHKSLHFNNYVLEEF